MRKIFKALIGILLLACLGGGGYLIYRWWTKPTAEQIEQNEKQKQETRQQIQQIKKWISEYKANWEKAKREETIFGQPQGIPKDPPKSPDPVYSDKELEKLIEEKRKAWNELAQLNTEIKAWQDELEAKWENWWKLQKDNGWQVLTSPLARNPEFHTRFDKLFKHFYQKAAEKKGVANNPRIEFEGFGRFYVEEEGKFGEMGFCEFIEKRVTNQGEFIRNEAIVNININQVYLLNKIGMDKFFPETTKSLIVINFDSLIETIAHEIAHAIQSAKNIDNFTVDAEVPDAQGNPGHVRSQCTSSVAGVRIPEDSTELTKPKYPQLVAEHTKFTEEFKQMIINSPEYKEFKVWWESN